MKNSILRFLVPITALFVLTFVSCSKEDDDDNDNNKKTCNTSFKSQQATGTFMTAPFTIVEGTAKVDPFDSTEFWIDLYGSAVPGDACDGFNFDKPDSSIIIIVPQAIGNYPLSNTRSVTFNNAQENNTTATVAVCGAIEIVNITATTVVGKIVADARDGESMINGDFTAQLCK